MEKAEKSDHTDRFSAFLYKNILGNYASMQHAYEHDEQGEKSFG